MKFLKTIVFTSLLLAVLGVPALAQTKIATVDVRKLFNNYWKTKQASTALDALRTDMGKQEKDMTDNYQKAESDYKQLLEQANDPAISPEERDKRKQVAAAKLQELNGSRSEIAEFDRTASARVSDEGQRMKQQLLGDIQKAVADKAKAGGYTLVVNSTDTDAFIYSTTDNDLTDAVLKQLNAGAPIDVTQPTPAFSPLLGTTNVPAASP